MYISFLDHGRGREGDHRYWSEQVLTENVRITSRASARHGGWGKALRPFLLGGSFLACNLRAPRIRRTGVRSDTCNQKLGAVFGCSKPRRSRAFPTPGRASFGVKIFRRLRSFALPLVSNCARNCRGFLGRSARIGTFNQELAAVLSVCNPRRCTTMASPNRACLRMSILWRGPAL